MKKLKAPPGKYCLAFYPNGKLARIIEPGGISYNPFLKFPKYIDRYGKAETLTTNLNTSANLACWILPIKYCYWLLSKEDVKKFNDKFRPDNEDIEWKIKKGIKWTLEKIMYSKAKTYDRKQRMKYNNRLAPGFDNFPIWREIRAFEMFFAGAFSHNTELIKNLEEEFGLKLYFPEFPKVNLDVDFYLPGDFLCPREDIIGGSSKLGIEPIVFLNGKGKERFDDSFKTDKNERDHIQNQSIPTQQIHYIDNRKYVFVANKILFNYYSNQEKIDRLLVDLKEYINEEKKKLIDELKIALKTNDNKVPNIWNRIINGINISSSVYTIISAIGRALGLPSP